MKINDCNNVNDFRKLAKRKLPSPIFHYIDGAADDEITYQRNTEAYNDCFLVPRVLNLLKLLIKESSFLEKKISLPFFFLQRHYETFSSSR